MKTTKKIEYYLFIVLLFLQNFAVITTEEFGINGLVAFMLVISIIRYKKYYMKINVKFLTFFFIAIVVLIFGSIINDTFYFTQIAKNILTVWLIYVVYIYVKEIYNDGNENYFWKYYTTIILIVLIYGIYEYIANIYQLPLFMNVFSNNTSYGIRTMTDYCVGGWIEEIRLYNVFFEPSAFAIFLVYNLFLIKELKYISKWKKVILFVLILFNLVSTYARTGYVIFIYMCGIYLIYKVLNKRAKLLDNIMLLLPIINLLIMYKIGLKLFTDLSSLERTYSSVYYLQSSFANYKNIFFGHGCGSVHNNIPTEMYVAHTAHNGYSDLIYQYGLPFFIYLIYSIKKLLKNVKSHRYLIVGAISTLCCFGVYFGVETIIATVVLIYVYCKEESKERINEKE